MCTASLEKGYFWNSAKKTNASQKQHVSFAMKLPLFGKQKDEPDDDENNDISRDQECEEGMEVAAMRQQAQCSWGAPPSQNATYNYGGGMRRVQSANASRPRGAVGAASSRNKPLDTAHKNRSHSQEARTNRDANAVYEVTPPPPSEQLPIPQCKNTLLEIARTKSDQTDLRRMYDYATWNMYDRIVSARNKKRISLEADNSDDLDATLNKEEGEKESSSSAPSKNTDKPSSSATTAATTSCNSSFTSSPSNNQAAIACKGTGIIKTSGNNKTTATIKKVQASTVSDTSDTTSSASATTTTATTSTQAMSTSSIYKQQAAATTTSTTKNNTSATQTSLHHKLRSIKKSFSSHDTDSSQGGTTATTESTSLESEDSSGSGRSACNSPATFPGCMMGRSTSHRTMSQGSEDDHFIFQLDM